MQLIITVTCLLFIVSNSIAVPYRMRLHMFHKPYDNDNTDNRATAYVTSTDYSSDYHHPGENQIPSSNEDYAGCCEEAPNNNGYGEPERSHDYNHDMEAEPEPSPDERVITGNGEGDYEEEEVVKVNTKKTSQDDEGRNVRPHGEIDPPKSAEVDKEPEKPKTHGGASKEDKAPDPISGEDDEDLKPKADEDLKPNLPSSSFNRKCSSYFDCDFAPPFTNTSGEYFESTWFNCNGKYCVCELFGVMQVNPFRVSWSKGQNQCVTDEGGPCGSHDGLEIHCATSYHCSDGKCVDSSKPKTTTEKPSSTTPACDCENGKDCEDQGVNPFSVLFFPKNIFDTVLNNTIKEITDSTYPNKVT